MSNRPTRFYSSAQEKKVAKAVSGRKVANSGATTFNKGDVTTDNFLIECKTCTKEQKTFTIKREWIEKNREEMFAMGKDYCALVFDFGDGNNYYVLDEKTFLMMKDLLDNNDKMLDDMEKEYEK